MIRPEEEAGEEDGDELIGALFDAEHGKTLRRFPVEGSDLSVRVWCIDEDAGALISGHYVWKGALAMAEVFAATGDAADERAGVLMSGTGVVAVELGCGCGLAGLAAVASERGRRLKKMLFTDRDEAVLEDVVRNVAVLEEDFGQRIECRALPLEWGSRDLPPDLVRELVSALDERDQLLVLGSDVIYTETVVRPLFTTVAALFQLATSARFAMTSSFAYEDVVEAEIDAVCEDLNISRRILSCELEHGGCRLQLFAPTQH